VLGRHLLGVSDGRPFPLLIVRAGERFTVAGL